MLRLISVNKYYKTEKTSYQALKQVHFEVQKGDFISIMGTSGSGKSTLINILGLLDKDFSGNYYFEEHDVSQLTDNQVSELRGDSIGFVFQHFNLLPEYTVIENILLPYLYRREKADKDYIDDLLEKMGLSDKKHVYPSDLSGGQKQRVAIIRALASRPSLLIADEPTGALDSSTRDDILSVLEMLNREGMTICIVTHDEVVAAIAKRHFILNDGNLYEEKE